ncbi:MAG: amino acid adenylation domain-containing protein, partial [Ferruginibacter sp.]
DGAGLNNQPTTNSGSSPAPKDLAYVIYTSGSTGKPKGVMIEHGSLVDYVFGLNEKTKIDQCRSFALVSTIATDLGNTVIFSSLVFGGALHLFSKETVSNAAVLYQYFKANQIDCLKIVPSHWKALGEDEKLLLPKKLLVFGGEALQAEMVEDIGLSGSNCTVVNHYGPTETTIGKLLHVVNDSNKYSGTIPIGKPFSNTQVYILSKELQPCPVGVLGQLYISGDGIARGYLNNDGLTKEKFIPNPFSKDGPVMYATGDLVKYLPGGDILFAGRVDDQVKIRGYRVELGEIESVLQQSALVKQAVVLAREDKQGNKRLVAYIVAEYEFDRDEIFSYLKGKLPDYMIPALLMELESLPLTANGKVDRKALPDPDASELLSDQYTAPRNEAEEKLAAIWQDVLEVEQVGIHDDFFELGGHSLLAIRLISAIRKELQVELPISDIFDYPTIATLIAQLEKKSGRSTLPPIKPSQPRPAQIPLSFSQERLWFIDQVGGSVPYHVPSVLRLKGDLNMEALAHSLKTIVNRHEVLRTVIIADKGQPFQVIMEPGNWQLNVIDWSTYSDHPVQLQILLKQLLNEPFDLAKDHMIRAAIVKVGDEENVLAVTMHHIASDGWSTSVLVKEVVELYQSYLQHRAPQLTPLPVQYADFAIWQRTYLQGDELEKKLNYWKDKLQDTAPLQLPSDYTRPAIQSSRGAVSNFRLDKEIYMQLQLLGQQQSATPFMVLLAAFKVLLHHYSGQKDICVGTAIAGRQQQEVEELIGFFINTLALRSSVNATDTFNDLLVQVKTTTMEAYDHQEVPFEKVVDAVVKERNMSRSPLFQVMFALQNTPAVPELLLGEVRLSREPFPQETTKFDLSVVLTETEKGLQGSFQYCTDLYSYQTIARMMGHFTNLIKTIIADPAQKIGELAILTSDEEQQVLTEFNKPIDEHAGEKTVIDLFEEQALRAPEAMALVYGEQKMDYKELHERSNQLAHYLIEKGVGKETLVPVCMHRSAEILVAMLGILKAGGAYVPIDPVYPAERIKYMLEDTGAKIILSQKNIQIPVLETLEIIRVDEDWASISQQPATGINSKAEPNQLVYVIYTSGSTGQPKGVMIEHRNLTNLINWHNEEFKVTASSRATSMAGVGFDAFGWEVWPYLAAGAPLYIVDDNKRLSVSQILSIFTGNGITHSFISTAVVQEFVNASRHKKLSLEYLLTGGDKLSVSSLEGISYAFVNNYGPTENTVVATNYHLTSKDEHKIPLIGKPILNTVIYILNECNKLMPAGVSGEICIGGAGLARGYWNREALTAEKFITNPFSEAKNSKIYKTGDLGRWLQNGDIEYLGRIDDQVKIRGYRIELGEIEMVLQKSGLVKQGVVLATQDKKENKNLVGYIVKNEGFNKQVLIEYLKERLPAYMIPSLWVEMEDFPLTPNGKIDKKKLPPAGEEALLKSKYVAPRNGLEFKLVEIWQELLGREQVGIEDNFFESGGNSLLAMRMVSYIERNLLLSVPIQLLFQFSCIADLSRYLQIQEKGDSREKTGTSFELLDV